ncbi:hypothetical protein FACS189449_13420 [Alphaproteobacteria bacterium]|nr:hypothetical protein FACS189449_13420 [Alphaproteobacteria bacterium]
MAKKAYHHVTRDLRCQIAALKSIGFTQRKIAREIGVSQSTISREIARNSVRPAKWRERSERHFHLKLKIERYL